MAEAHELTLTHAINLAFVHDLPEAKHVPLLAILTRTDFEDLPTVFVWPNATRRPWSVCQREAKLHKAD
jgi:hypothetical protein